ncbi:hypothetical protein [Gilvibacter sp.]|uniref:hypothetical protein n=1 Tax=Gilvibacter sp. TaxID=2729997 RepID=UPI003F4A6BC4
MHYFWESGISVALECSQLKDNGADFWLWTLGGTAGIGFGFKAVVVLLIRAGIINEQLKKSIKK